MGCHSIADILRGLGEVPPSEVRSTDRIEPQPIEIVTDPPMSLATPWIDPDRIRASIAKDVVERNNDDRSYAVKSALGSHFVAVVRAVHKTKRIVKPKAAPKPKVKKERTPELKEYYRNYGRMWRARRKAEMADAQ
jgi:hypothetical protein